MSTFSLGKDQGMDQQTNPALLPLAKALGGLVQSMLPPRVESVPMVRIVEDLPQAPALVRFDQKEIYVRQQSFIGVDADEVGSGEWLLRFSDVVGLIFHELGHWIYSPTDFDKFIKTTVKEADQRRVLVLLEESRIEFMIMNYWKEQREAGARSSLHREAGIKARIYMAGLQQSIYLAVLRNLTLQGAGWQDLSEAMLLVSARIWGGSAREDDPRLNEIQQTLRPLFTAEQWDEARRIVVRYQTMTNRNGGLMQLAYGHAHGVELIGRLKPGSTTRSFIEGLVVEWIDLMKQVADSNESPGGGQGDQQDDESEDGDQQDSDQQDSDQEPDQGGNGDGNPDPNSDSEQDSDSEDSEQGSEPGDGDPSDGDSRDQQPDDSQGDGQDDSPDAESSQEPKGGSDGKGTKAWEKFKDKIEELANEIPEDDFSQDGESKSDLRDALTEADEFDAKQTIERQRSMAKYRDAWN